VTCASWARCTSARRSWRTSPTRSSRSPGGIGTFEELFEVYTWAQLGLHRKPLGLLDVAGYYGPLGAMLDHAVQQRFVRPETRAMLVLEESLDALLERFAGWEPPGVRKWIERDET